jgi:hypothetical protein
MHSRLFPIATRRRRRRRRRKGEVERGLQRARSKNIIYFMSTIK